jgi:hypothetical protein
MDKVDVDPGHGLHGGEGQENTQFRLARGMSGTNGFELPYSLNA